MFLTTLDAVIIQTMSPSELDDPAEIERLRALYLEMVKLSVGDFLYDFDQITGLYAPFPMLLEDPQTGRSHWLSDYAALKENGLIGSPVSHTIIGLKRLNQLQAAIETVLREGIPGDLIETGVLRGGACIFMRAVLEAYAVRDRKVWVADSFSKGFPFRPPQPGQVDFNAGNKFTAPREVVEENFRRYELLDSQVVFLEGYFSDTLPGAPIEQLAVLRLDGDMYISTRDALEALYPKVSAGGFVIVDDFFAFDECCHAVMEYRTRHGIHSRMERIDPVAVFWRKD